MCGFIQRVTDNPTIIDLLEDVGLGDLVPHFSQQPPKTLNFYPAFGGNAARQLTSIIAGPNNVIDATWWFDCQPDGDTLALGKRTTFNARNLDSGFWRYALNHHRGIVIATALGESNPVGKSKQHYFMQGQRAFMLGALYRPFENGHYASAVITRPPHERFSQFHEKSFPFFLPFNQEFIAQWLSGEPLHPALMQELDNPKLPVELKVTPVKTFKSEEPIGETMHLAVDE
ncbi:SOS response-associated peptidase family protein [Alteromonas sp. ASW11-130]|uniref:SOS response-associated peptidase family protein n=1 Tax=Alteromonas sp. ASW11-130 TaxID=3015775 RepID=UPI00224267DD|nr:SOS response-associated peptidase family protein [Alteromonas sp. ASW11-130]MCW8093157.1 SOS response-associated peptidase family protein [Alteromonas sp. ASW11-130]